LTDIEGVLDASKRVQPTLTAEDCERLIRESVATGGMQAKLNAAAAALEHGVEQVEIAPGAALNVLVRLFAGETMGTRIVRARERVVCHD